jgi:hypothetical protein
VSEYYAKIISRIEKMTNDEMFYFPITLGCDSQGRSYVRYKGITVPGLSEEQVCNIEFALSKKQSELEKIILEEL